MENSKEEDKLFICRIRKTLQKYNLPSPEENTRKSSKETAVEKCNEKGH